MIASERATARLLNPFIVDLLNIGARIEGRHDLGMIMLLVHLANVEGLHADREQWRLGEFLTPDEDRRPISALAIADGLHISRETARRQVATLVSRGSLRRRGHEGVFVPADYLNQPKVHTAQIDLILSFMRVRRVATSLGLAWPDGLGDETCDPATRPDPIPLGLAARQIMTFGFRFLPRYMQVAGRAEHVLLSAAISAINFSRVMSDPALCHAHASLDQGPVPNRLRVPATISAIQQASGLSRATIFRLVAEHVEAGMLLRQDHGVIIVDANDTPALRAMMVDAHRYFLATAPVLAGYGLTNGSMETWEGELFKARANAA